MTSGQVASVVFAADLASFFPATILADTRCTVRRVSSQSWPALMVRPPREEMTFASPKHVFMHSFLNSARRTQADLRQKYRRPGMTARDYRSMDVAVAQRLKALVRDVEIRRERVTVKWLLDAAGAVSALKHHYAEMPRTRAFLLNFRQSNQSARQLGLRPEWRRRSANRASASEEHKRSVIEQAAAILASADVSNSRDVHLEPRPGRRTSRKVVTE